MTQRPAFRQAVFAFGSGNRYASSATTSLKTHPQSQPRVLTGEQAFHWRWVVGKKVEVEGERHL